MWAWLLALLPKLGQFATGINFGQYVPQALGFLTSTWDLIVKYWRFIVPVLLILVNLGLAYGWDQTTNALKAERVSHQADIDRFAAAQKAANDQANKEREILKKEAKANADQADASYSALYAKYRSNLLRYEATQSGTGKANHSELQPAQSGNGPSASPELPDGTINISVADANICAVNTARLQAVHDWALNPPKEPSDAVENSNP